MRHANIWRALDALAAKHGMTVSALAKAAGLDATAFNKSKRIGTDGRARWPSTESLALVLSAVGASFEEFAALIDGPGGGRTIPVVGLARAGADGFFDESGFPTSFAETIRFPGIASERVYAVEIVGDSMEPVFRHGDTVIVQPGAPVRRGDRVVVKTAQGEAFAKILQRRTEELVELASVNPTYPLKTLASRDVEWIARIIWSSQ